MVDGVRQGEGWETWDSGDPADWVREGHAEESAAERLARAARIADAHDHAVQLSPVGGPWSPATPRRRIGRTARLVLAGLGVALTAGAWVAAQPGEPLGRPAAAPEGEGGYAFLDVRPDGRPVTFDPCREIHYVVRPDGSPPSGAAMLAAALAEVSRATGLVFVDDGTTDEAPSADRHERDRWALRDSTDPVLVAWATESEWPSLAGTVVGEAGPVSESVGRSVPRYVSGQVVLDARDLHHAPGDAVGAEQVRLVLLHELGHLVGLGHVSDPGQLMHAESASGLSGFGAGDLRGLHELGRGTCV